MIHSPEMLADKARYIAEQHMDVQLQEAVGNFEKEMYYQHLLETRDYIRNRLIEKTGTDKLDGWIVCGSGLASLPNSPDIKICDRISVNEIPNWFSPQAPGHGKELIIADIKGQLVGITTGRAHIYDSDYSPRQLRMITAPLIVAKGLGINWLITTNAAGVLDNGHVQVGDVVVDIDYVNHHGINPMIGPNDDRLGVRFAGKANVADPYMFNRLEQYIPPGNLHLGIYTLASNTPFYEGYGDVINGTYEALTQQNPQIAEAYGMSFAMEAMVMQHYNDPPKDINGFDRKIRWIGMTAATDVIPPVLAPTKEMLRAATISNPNPTSEEEVLEGGVNTEKLLVPAIVEFCKSCSTHPLETV